MSLLSEVKAVSEEVYEFLKNVGDVGEESITDYLVWKWRKADKKFSFLDVEKFTKEEESSLTGADFQLELWFVGPKRSLPLVIQAKKVVKEHNVW